MQKRISHFTNKKSAKASFIDKKIIDKNLFETLVCRPRMIWIRSIQSGDEFVVTDFQAASHPKNQGYPYHVFHRHPGDAECHYHANEKNFEDAMRHISTHDRKAVWIEQNRE